MTRRAISTKGYTVSTTAVTLSDFGFTTSQIDQARRAVVSAINGDINITWDGTTATATLGHPITDGTWASVSVRGISRLSLIRYSTTDANVTVTLEH